MTGPHDTEDDATTHATLDRCPCCDAALTAPLSELISAAEIMARLDIGEKTLSGMVNSGTIPAIKTDRTWRFPRAAFEALMGGYQAEREAAIAKAVRDTEAAIRRESARKLWLIERNVTRAEKRTAAAKSKLTIARAHVSAPDFLTSRGADQGAD